MPNTEIYSYNMDVYQIEILKKVICYQLPSENSLPTFRLKAPVIRAKWTTGAFSQNIGKLFSKLSR